MSQRQRFTRLIRGPDGRWMLGELGLLPVGLRCRLRAPTIPPFMSLYGSIGKQNGEDVFLWASGDGTPPCPIRLTEDTFIQPISELE